LLERRREEFYQDYVQPLTREARKLGITIDSLTGMINRSSSDPVLTERSAGR
jgi:GntR family transcriptional regulator